MMKIQQQEQQLAFLPLIQDLSTIQSELQKLRLTLTQNQKPIISENFRIQTQELEDLRQYYQKEIDVIRMEQMDIQNSRRKLVPIYQKHALQKFQIISCQGSRNTVVYLLEMNNEIKTQFLLINRFEGKNKVFEHLFNLEKSYRNVSINQNTIILIEDFNLEFFQCEQDKLNKIGEFGYPLLKITGFLSLDNMLFCLIQKSFLSCFDISQMREIIFIKCLPRQCEIESLRINPSVDNQIVLISKQKQFYVLDAMTLTYSLEQVEMDTMEKKQVWIHENYEYSIDGFEIKVK